MTVDDLKEKLTVEEEFSPLENETGFVFTLEEFLHYASHLKLWLFDLLSFWAALKCLGPTHGLVGSTNQRAAFQTRSGDWPMARSGWSFTKEPGPSPGTAEGETTWAICARFDACFSHSAKKSHNAVNTINIFSLFQILDSKMAALVAMGSGPVLSNKQMATTGQIKISLSFQKKLTVTIHACRSGVTINPFESFQV